MYCIRIGSSKCWKHPNYLKIHTRIIANEWKPLWELTCLKHLLNAEDGMLGGAI